MFARYQTEDLSTCIAMLVTATDFPNQYWLMVLKFRPFNFEILDNNASLYLARGEVPYPMHYKKVKAKCAELITEVQKND